MKKLSNLYHYTILSEDAQMETFITTFLKCNGVPSYKIYKVPIPVGKGCGEQHVRERFLQEVEVLERNNYNRRTLVVCIDADKHPCDERRNELVNSVKTTKHLWTISKEMILLWIPKREMETWIAFFRGEPVDEQKEFRHDGNPVSCKKEAGKMADYCQNDDPPKQEMLPSLVKAKEEFIRVCELQKSREK